MRNLYLREWMCACPGMDGGMDEWMHTCMNGWMDGWMDGGWMDGSIGRWMDPPGLSIDPLCIYPYG